MAAILILAKSYPAARNRGMVMASNPYLAVGGASHNRADWGPGLTLFLVS